MNDRDLRDTLRLLLRYIDRNDRGLRDEAMAILRRMDDEARADLSPRADRPKIEMVTVPEGEFLYDDPPVIASLPTFVL